MTPCPHCNQPKPNPLGLCPHCCRFPRVGGLQAPGLTNRPTWDDLRKADQPQPPRYTAAIWVTYGGRVRHRRRLDANGEAEAQALCGYWGGDAWGSVRGEALPECAECGRRAG